MRPEGMTLPGLDCWSRWWLMGSPWPPKKPTSEAGRPCPTKSMWPGHGYRLADTRYPFDRPGRGGDGGGWTNDSADCRPDDVRHPTCDAMMRAGESSFGRGIAVFLFLWLMISTSTACTWFTGKGKPGWVDGRSTEYPSTQYLTGVGQADIRSNAEDQAYAAVARIFKAEVAAQAKDWESYLVVENRGASNAERRLTIDNVTKVSTDKVLENVRIADVWYDSDSRLYYALGVMNRSQAEATLMEKVSALDRAIEADVAESRQTTDKLAKVRALRRAGRNLVLREVYNTDLRVIRLSGHGTHPLIR